jgi:L-2,4-diaminobutyric acid acetyltransferase
VDAGLEGPPSAGIERPFALRSPTLKDGAGIWDLVRRSKPLDENSCYAYLLLCEHFSDTCVVAEREGATAGFVSAYLPPRTDDTVFVWQVAVDRRARGMGVASAMLDYLLASSACAHVRFLETTVSPSNSASRALFHRLAKRSETICIEMPLFMQDLFAGFNHEDEVLFRIGPLQPGGESGEVNEVRDSRENVYGE